MQMIELQVDLYKGVWLGKPIISTRNYAIKEEFNARDKNNGTELSPECQGRYLESAFPDSEFDPSLMLFYIWGWSKKKKKKKLGRSKRPI